MSCDYKDAKFSANIHSILCIEFFFLKMVEKSGTD